MGSQITARFLFWNHLCSLIPKVISDGQANDSSESSQPCGQELRGATRVLEAGFDLLRNVASGVESPVSLQALSALISEVNRSAGPAGSALVVVEPLAASLTSELKKLSGGQLLPFAAHLLAHTEWPRDSGDVLRAQKSLWGTALARTEKDPDPFHHLYDFIQCGLETAETLARTTPLPALNFINSTATFISRMPAYLYASSLIKIMSAIESTTCSHPWQHDEVDLAIDPMWDHILQGVQRPSVINSIRPIELEKVLITGFSSQRPSIQKSATRIIKALAASGTDIELSSRLGGILGKAEVFKERTSVQKSADVDVMQQQDHTEFGAGTAEGETPQASSGIQELSKRPAEYDLFDFDAAAAQCTPDEQLRREASRALAPVPLPPKLVDERSIDGTGAGSIEVIVELVSKASAEQEADGSSLPIEPLEDVAESVEANRNEDHKDPLETELASSPPANPAKEPDHEFELQNEPSLPGVEMDSALDEMERMLWDRFTVPEDEYALPCDPSSDDFRHLGSSPTPSIRRSEPIVQGDIFDMPGSSPPATRTVARKVFASDPAPILHTKRVQKATKRKADALEAAAVQRPSKANKQRQVAVAVLVDNVVRSVETTKREPGRQLVVSTSATIAKKAAGATKMSSPISKCQDGRNEEASKAHGKAPLPSADENISGFKEGKDGPQAGTDLPETIEETQKVAPPELIAESPYLQNPAQQTEPSSEPTTLLLKGQKMVTTSDSQEPTADLIRPIRRSSRAIAEPDLATAAQSEDDDGIQEADCKTQKKDDSVVMIINSQGEEEEEYSEIEIDQSLESNRECSRKKTKSASPTAGPVKKRGRGGPPKVKKQAEEQEEGGEETGLLEKQTKRKAGRPRGARKQEGHGEGGDGLEVDEEKSTPAPVADSKKRKSPEEDGPPPRKLLNVREEFAKDKARWDAIHAGARRTRSSAGTALPTEVTPPSKRLKNSKGDGVPVSATPGGAGKDADPEPPVSPGSFLARLRGLISDASTLVLGRRKKEVFEAVFDFCQAINEASDREEGA